MATRKRSVSTRSSGTRKRKTSARASPRKGPDIVTRLRQQLAECTRGLREALEQQKATSEILQVISSSPTDLKPVFDAILENATRLCDAHMANLALYDGDTYLNVAQRGGSAEFSQWITNRGPYRIVAGGHFARMIAERQPIHISDLRDTPGYRDRTNLGLVALAELGGARSFVWVPMLKEGRVVGRINIYRPEVRPFSQKQIDLVSTFANQAVIAIENVRLFNETKEALERQTVVSDILRVISSSPTDTQPVFDAIVNSGVHLFNGMNVSLRLVKGDQVERVAGTLPIHETGGAFSTPLEDDAMPGSRAILRREVVQVPDFQAAEEWVSGVAKQRAQQTGYRAIMHAPMLRENNVIGTVNVMRAAPGPFTDKQVALLKTFADQAVIAIENVRLFKELQAKNADLTESLDRQTATTEILRVISSSPTDIQPVLDAVAESAARLCDANDVVIRRVVGDVLTVAAHIGTIPVQPDGNVGLLQLRTFMGTAARECRTIHIPDITEPHVREKYPDSITARGGIRTVLYAPLLREGVAIGVIVMRRREVRPFTDKQVELLETFAAQAVIAIENVRLFKELQARNAEVTEALEQQTATSEILKVISSSPTNLQPVFDAILENATRLCDAHMANLVLNDGDTRLIVAERGGSAEYVKWVANRGPYRPPAGGVNSRIIAERRPIQVADLRDSSEYRDRTNPSVIARVELAGARTLLVVPMLKEGRVVGALTIYRPEVRPFSQKQIDLVSTFANQAVIAIENVRLFNETKEALEQQTVISEILRVIGSSPTDTQPVFDAIVKSGVHLFGGMDVSLRLVKGDHLETVASTRPNYDTSDVNPVALDDEGMPGPRAMRRREVVQVPDFLGAEEWVSARSKQQAERRGFRAMMHAPMLREDKAIGSISVNRATPGPFLDKQVALLTTFADQAVIAIENVRLFKELQARNAEITEALEQQTATAEILRVISSSPTDLKPVFDAILENATRLCDAHMANLMLYDGDTCLIVAQRGGSAEYAKWVTNRGPFRPVAGGSAARMIAERRLIQIADLRDSPGYRNRNPGSVELVELGGARSYVMVPMLKEGRVVGIITVYRPEVRPFTQKQIDLVSTFANQAVIAIENVRLFKELQARNAEVTEALEQQTATADILKVISSSPTEIQPVLDAVAENAARLCGAIDVIVRRVEGAVLRVAAHFGSVPVVQETVEIGIRRGVGRAFLERRTIHIHDIDSDQARAEYPESLAESHQGSRWRTMLVVPLMREGSAIGTIAVRRPEVRPFSDKQIALLETFAAQAVIAIENVRLFKELQARNAEVTEALEQQTATAEILRVISSSPTDVTPVLEAVTHRAAQLCDAPDARLFLVEEDTLRYVVGFGDNATRMALPLTRGLVIGRAILDRKVIHIKDIAASFGEFPEAREAQQLYGHRTTLAVPLMREGKAFGGIIMRRKHVRPFTQKQIELVTTFADQAVIAIENVRLFNEIQDKSRQLEVANKHKSDFLAHMSHELRTPLNAVIGFSEALIARMFGELNAKQDEYLNDIHSSGHHLLSLINDILDLSKIEAGRMELELSEFSLPAALSNALTLVRERAQNHGIALQLDVDAGLETICADERKMKQIVLNLLSNAVKFTPDGGRVELAARRTDGVVEISVKDTGFGIAPEDQESLFEEFRQVGRDRARKQEGTGLGLALTRRFVELHGGRISLQSAPGEGSTFTFTLPLR